MLPRNFARPCDVIPGNPDRRTLGIMLQTIHLDGQPVPLDDARLTEGWQKIEPDHRWTNGHATIDPAGATRLALTSHSLGHYPNLNPTEPATTGRIAA